MPDNTTPIQQWEYKIESHDPLNFTQREFTERWLNAMGASGWEVCNVEVVHSSLVFYIFKRAISLKQE